MTGPLRVAEQVWVVSAEAGQVTRSAHRADLLRASALPGWRAERFLAGRGLLRELLGTVRPALAGAEITADRHGRPRLADHPGLGVSVSHSDGAVAAGVAPGRDLGVDLQHPGASVSPSFARRLLGVHADRLAGLPAARVAEEVAWVWTAQESCVKASGAGLAGRPWTIEVPPGARTGRWGDYRWVSLREHSPTPFSCAFRLGKGER